MSTVPNSAFTLPGHFQYKNKHLQWPLFLSSPAVIIHLLLHQLLDTLTGRRQKGAPFNLFSMQWRDVCILVIALDEKLVQQMKPLHA